MAHSIDRIDHVNIPIPVGGEPEAERFWVDVLGFGLRPKPERLASQGGRWFVQEGFEIHVSPKQSFQPTSDSHIAMRVTGLDQLVVSLEDRGFHALPTTSFADDEQRYFVHDPFGNRLELISAKQQGSLTGESEV